MLLAAPADVAALNFFFDTFFFWGAILLLANSIDNEQLWRGFSSESCSRRADGSVARLEMASGKGSCSMDGRVQTPAIEP